MNEADGESSSAFGHKNNANKVFSVAVGSQNISDAENSSAIGFLNKTTGKNSVAFGAGYLDENQEIHYNEAKEEKSLAVGIGNTSSKIGSITFGSQNTSNAENSSAIGFLNKTDGEKSSAFGVENNATKDYSSAIGYKNTAGGKNSSAVGYNNIASGENSSSLGLNNKTEGVGSVALGANNVVSKNESLAFGVNNKTNSFRSATIGFNNTTTGNFSSAVGFDNVAGLQSSAFGFQNVANSENSVAFGSANKATNVMATTFGFANQASGRNSIALGYRNSSSAQNSIAIGIYSVASPSAQNGIAIGNYSEAASYNSILLGNQYKVTGLNSAAIGIGEIRKSQYIYVNQGHESYMIGNRNKIAMNSHDNFILGNNVSIPINIENSVVLGSNSMSAGSKTVSVGSPNLKRKVVYVENGAVNSNSTEAINGSQLYALAKATSTDIDVNAWRAKLGIATKKTASSDKVEYTTLANKELVLADTTSVVGSTALGVDNVVTGNYSTAVGYKNKVSGNNSGAFGDPNIVTGSGSYAFGNNNTINGNNNFVLGNNVTIGAGISNSVVLGNNSTVASSNEVSVGSATQKRKITNVADGDISATSTDAITGKQLYKAMQSSSGAGIENLRNDVYEKIDNIKDEMRSVGSLSAALAGLHPMQYDPKAPAQVMVALGHYKNRQSVAVGASYYFNDRFMMSTGVALSGEKKTKAMANVGFTLKLGKSSGVTYEEAPLYTIQDEVKRLTVENNKQAKENQELKFQINEQNERIKKLEEKLESLSNKK